MAQFIWDSKKKKVIPKEQAEQNNAHTDNSPPAVDEVKRPGRQRKVFESEDGGSE